MSINTINYLQDRPITD